MASGAQNKASKVHPYKTLPTPSLAPIQPTPHADMARLLHLVLILSLALRAKAFTAAPLHAEPAKHAIGMPMAVTAVRMPPPLALVPEATSTVSDVSMVVADGSSELLIDLAAALFIFPLMSLFFFMTMPTFFSQIKNSARDD